MTHQLYLEDAYLKECDATILQVTDEGIMLDKTIFYAEGGGQPSDTGIITKGNETYQVTLVKKGPQGILHHLDKKGLQIGDMVHLKINWQRRYALMRYHTAAHLLSAVIYKETQCETTGNQIAPDKTRMDFSLDISKEQVGSFIAKANEWIAKDAQVKVYILSKEEAMKDPTLFKLAIKEYIEKLKEVRVVEIEGIDKQADGGTHIHSLKEVGPLKLERVDNKGKNNKRIYFTLEA